MKKEWTQTRSLWRGVDAGKVQRQAGEGARAPIGDKRASDGLDGRSSVGPTVPKSERRVHSRLVRYELKRILDVAPCQRCLLGSPGWTSFHGRLHSQPPANDFPPTGSMTEVIGQNRESAPMGYW